MESMNNTLGVIAFTLSCATVVIASLFFGL